MLSNVTWLGHSSIKIVDNITIYIDPYNIKDSYNDADVVFITHSHYDHFSIDDLRKCIKRDTALVVTKDLEEKVKKLDINNSVIVIPNEEYEIKGVLFKTIPSYNTNKKFHPRENNWVGYIIKYNNIRYYIAGDTDITEEAKKVECDIAFLPIGGTYTMNHEEAAKLANLIKPRYVIPVHYGTIVGSYQDALLFKDRIDSNINCVIL